MLDSARWASVTTRYGVTSRHAKNFQDRVVPFWNDSLPRLSVTTRSDWNESARIKKILSLLLH